MNVLSLDALIRSLKTHEIELNEASKESNRKGKSITLKTTQKKSSTFKAIEVAEDSDEDKDEFFDDDDEKDKTAHLARKISKALIKRKKEELCP